jgi:3-oxoacyl-[acyl-carrier-protein] synthase II
MMGTKTPNLAITGMGVVLPCGTGIQVAKDALVAQSHSFAELPPELGQKNGMYCGATCTDFSDEGIIPPMTSRRLDRCARFAWLAASQALSQAMFDSTSLSTMEIPMAIAVGTITGGGEAAEGFMMPYLQYGRSAASPIYYQNSVAVSTSGHLAIAFGIKGASTTQLGRESSFISAIEQADRWLALGMAQAVMVVGADALHPLVVELMYRSRLSCRKGKLPKAFGGTGLLPGEGSQVFILEPAQCAKLRGAETLAEITHISVASPKDNTAEHRAEALARAANCACPGQPQSWVGGSNGHRVLDCVESMLAESRKDLPNGVFPKTLWGELCGGGGQLLTAAMLDGAEDTLVTSPASMGLQGAIKLRKHS